MQSMWQPRPCPKGAVLCGGGQCGCSGREEVAGTHTGHRVLVTTGLDLDLVRTLVGGQKHPDCRGREPVAFCGGGALLGAELRPVLGYAKNEVGELRCSEPGITQVEEPTP